MPPIAELDAIVARVRKRVESEGAFLTPFDPGFPQEIIGEVEAICEKNRDNPALEGYLDILAMQAMRMKDESSFSKRIVILADKLGIHSWNLRLLATDMLLFIVRRDEEAAQILDAVIPDDVLKRESRPISDEEWREMQDFATKLRGYL